MVSLTTPRSPATEAYRTLRTAVQFLPLDGVTMIQVTSPTAGDGKTTTLANLGVALARAGQQVALVCCDLRRPKLHEFFGMTNDVGFTSVLLGKVPLSAALQQVPDQDRLYVLASGPLPPNPSELLSSRRAREVLASLRAEAEVVLIDSPPVLPVSDAMIIAGLVDVTLIVCAADRTSTRDVTRAVEQLRQVEAPLVGAILNGAGPESAYGGKYGYDTLEPAPGSAKGPAKAGRPAKGPEGTPAVRAAKAALPAKPVRDRSPSARQAVAGVGAPTGTPPGGRAGGGGGCRARSGPSRHTTSRSKASWSVSRMTASAAASSSAVATTRCTRPSVWSSTTWGSAARTSAPRATRRSATTTRRRLAVVAGVGLVGQAQEQDPAAVDRLLLAVEGQYEALHHVVGHVVVDVVGQLDEPELLAQQPPHPPRQVAGVDGQAVAADARPGGEAHEPEGLGGGRVDGLPHVDAQVGGEHGQLVDQGDVDVPEGVLQQLGHLGLLGADTGTVRSTMVS